MIAFLGMGLLGSNFTKAMLRKGQQVNVWNRTAAKAKALEEFGARAFDDVVEAVKGAERIHLVVSDDAAVNEVLEKASAGFAPGVIIIDHTTTSATGAAERTTKWKQRGYTYLHAPVFMGPSNALESTGYMLVSGDQKLIAKLEPILSQMTGKLLNFGTEPNRAAGIKLLGNSFLLFLTAGLSDTLALAKSMNIPSSDFVSLFDTWNPGAMTPSRLKRILAADYDNPSWELNMARKDARLMMEEANRAGKHLAAIPAIAAEMDKWIAKGDAHKDWTVIAKDNV
jgi:3-hydroxyisobutyrate dehydrogenase